MAGETVKCNTCHSTNMNRSLLSTFYPVRNPYADDAQEALGAILEFIQMGAPARVTTGGAASQSGTCDTIPERVICNIIHTSYPYNTTHPTELQLSRSHCVSITAHIKVTPVLTMRRHVNRHPGGVNSIPEGNRCSHYVRRCACCYSSETRPFRCKSPATTTSRGNKSLEFATTSKCSRCWCGW